MFNKKNNQTGFTFIEVIIVIGIIGILTAMTIPSWQSFSDFINLKDSAKMIETKIKLAKNYSLNSLNDKNYGVRIETDKITIFNAITSADIEVYNLMNGVEIYNIATAGGGANPLCNNGIIDAGETNIDCGGGCLPCSSIVFNRLTGTSNSGTFSIRMINRPAQTKIISVNAQGQTGTDTFGTSTDSGIFEDTANSMNARHIHFALPWSIQTYDTLRLEWSGVGVTTPVTKNIDITTGGYFNADKSSFDWEGMETVDSADQTLIIHTVSLDASATSLCIIRDRTENNESLIVSFLKSGVEKEIVTYTESGGVVTVASDNFNVTSPIDSQ